MSVPWNKIAKAAYPSVGFEAQVKAGKRKIVLDENGPCREEVIYSVRNRLQEEGYSRGHGQNWYDGSMKKRAGSALDLDNADLKQPGLTFLYATNDMDEGLTFICMRECCTEPTLALLDALVGPACVLLDHDRYVGDWWQTSLDEFLSKSEKRNRWALAETTYKWYGTSNFFLRHPSLLSIVLGLFRQAFMLVDAGAEADLLKKIDRKEVEDCLTNADPGLALRLVIQTKPWLESSRGGTFFPFSSKNFRLLTDLHKAIFKHGYDEVFGGNLEDSWNLDAVRTGQVEGAFTYFGTKAKETPNRKRVAKLAKK